MNAPSWLVVMSMYTVSALLTELVLIPARKALFCRLGPWVPIRIVFDSLATPALPM